MLYVFTAIVFFCLCLFAIVHSGDIPSDKNSGLADYFTPPGDNYVLEGVALHLPADELWQSYRIKAGTIAIDNISLAGVNSSLSSVLHIQNFHIDLVGLADTQSIESIECVEDVDNGPLGVYKSMNLHNYVLPFGPESRIWQNYCNVSINSISEIYIRDFNISFNNSRLPIREIGASKVEGSALKQDLILYGAVSIENNKGEKLNCSRCRWDFDREVFVVDGRFLLQTAKGKKSGYGGTFDYHLSFARPGKKTMISKM